MSNRLVTAESRPDAKLIKVRRADGYYPRQAEFPKEFIPRGGVDLEKLLRETDPYAIINSGRYGGRLGPVQNLSRADRKLVHRVVMIMDQLYRDGRSSEAKKVGRALYLALRKEVTP